MCGRFSLTKEEAAIEKRFNAKFYSNDLIKRYNVAPGQLSLVITGEKPEELQLFKWGLVPSWASESKIGYKMINAKSETIFEKPSFRNLIKKRRCLVISDGFYEWKPLAGKHKQPYRILLKDAGLFAFAGLWDAWTDKSTGEIMNTFTVITTDANEQVAPIHDRMPVILHEEDEKKWIGSDLKQEEIAAMLKPIESNLIDVYPVSERVNSPVNDDENILNPIATEDRNNTGTTYQPGLFD
jgi:putative SOS response-associated peptidase YedK